MLNKLKIGDTVELKTRTVRHFVKNLGLLYTNPSSREFITDYASEVAMFLGCYTKLAEKPIGKVVGYGAWVDGNNTKFVLVKARNKFGKSDVLPLQEEDVSLLKKKR